MSFVSYSAILLCEFLVISAAHSGTINILLTFCFGRLSAAVAPIRHAARGVRF